MKYNKFVQAYSSLQKLSNYELPVKDAYAVFKLMKSLREEYEFAVQREKALMEKYGGEPQEDGGINFVHGEDEESISAGSENMQSFIAELNELRDMDIQMEIAPASISYDSMGDHKITPNEIMALDGFVDFE